MERTLTRHETEQIAWYFVENPNKCSLDENPPFAGADLYGANLTRADLSGANLTRADLYGADLYGANLYGANLTEADLTRANLYGANLTRANLTEADLTRANLTEADLTRADLYGADLTEADLTRANLENALIFCIYLPDMSSCNDALRGGWRRHDGRKVVFVRAGCFNGTLSEFEEKIRRDPNHGENSLYLATLPLLRLWGKRQGVEDETIPAKAEAMNTTIDEDGLARLQAALDTAAGEVERLTRENAALDMQIEDVWRILRKDGYGKSFAATPAAGLKLLLASLKAQSIDPEDFRRLVQENEALRATLQDIRDLSADEYGTDGLLLQRAQAMAKTALEEGGAK